MGTYGSKRLITIDKFVEFFFYMLEQLNATSYTYIK